MHADYHNSAIKQLRGQQVRFAPRDIKIEQAQRAERLLAEIDPKREYPYDYLYFRITDFRADSDLAPVVTGTDVHHDLRLFVEDLSDAADIRAEDAGEPVHTVDDLSRMFHVSTKTISRWRNQGLVSRRFILEGRKRVGFLQSSVDRFVDGNQDRVERGERFSQLSEQERDEIVERARRLAQAGGTPAEVTRRIARHMNRSVETIRYTLKEFDKSQPRAAIFAKRGALTDDVRRRIYEQNRRGVSIEALGRKYGRTKTSIYRVIHEEHVRRINDLPLDFIPSDEFSKRNAERVILTDAPKPQKAARRVKAPAGLPPYLASLYEVPLLTAEQERHLFRKFNFLKFKAAKLRQRLGKKRLRTTTLDKIEALYQQAVDVKNQIVQANLRLVVSIAKRHVSAVDDFFGLISDGNMSLIRAVEKFDYSRGNKFSTYASWAIMKNFARTIPDEFKQRDRYRTSFDELFASRQDERSDQVAEESAQKARERQIGRMLSHLDDREQKIIISRFGLDHRQEPLTLKEVGAEMGVTKERVRQLEARALTKLRVAAQSERFDLLE